MVVGKKEQGETKGFPIFGERRDKMRKSGRDSGGGTKICVVGLEKKARRKKIWRKGATRVAHPQREKDVLSKGARPLCTQDQRKNRSYEEGSKIGERGLIEPVMVIMYSSTSEGYRQTKKER